MLKISSYCSPEVFICVSIRNACSTVLRIGGRKRKWCRVKSLILNIKTCFRKEVKRLPMLQFSVFERTEGHTYKQAFKGDDLGHLLSVKKQYCLSTTSVVLTHLKRTRHRHQLGSTRVGSGL